MPFPLIIKRALIHKKPHNKVPVPKKPTVPKRMILTDPNSLIGYRIDGGRIKLMSLLGVGGNGVVYRAIECLPDGVTQPTEPRQFAVKALSKIGLDPRQVRFLEREFELHTRVTGHPHILSFHGIIEEDDFFFVLLDYCPGGDLFDMMELHRAYLGNDELIKSVFLQLIDAVEHIHSLGVSHRDIKPENILCKDDGSHIFLADFGLATDRKVVKDFGLGSEPYMAPQCFGGFWKKLGPYSTPHADLWSLGVVLVNLACARNPWHKATEESSIYKIFLNNPNHLMDILPISSELNEVLKPIFAVNPQARMSLGELKVKVQAIKRFTLTNEELKHANPNVRNLAKRPAAAQKQPKLTPGAPHAAVARQITNLSAEDIDRLESEAREEARDATLRHEQEVLRTISVNSDSDSDHLGDAEACTLFMSPTFSPTSTVVGEESTPRFHDAANLDVELTPPLETADSDSDLESEAPITPESLPIADADIEVASVPDMILDGECQAQENFGPISPPATKPAARTATKNPQDGRPVVSRRLKKIRWF